MRKGEGWAGIKTAWQRQNEPWEKGSEKICLTGEEDNSDLHTRLKCREVWRGVRRGVRRGDRRSSRPFPSLSRQFGRPAAFSISLARIYPPDWSANGPKQAGRTSCFWAKLVQSSFLCAAVGCRLNGSATPTCPWGTCCNFRGTGSADWESAEI